MCIRDRLWGGPFVLLLAAAAVAWRRIRRRPAAGKAFAEAELAYAKTLTEQAAAPGGQQQPE